jgi:hypothetical protein
MAADGIEDIAMEDQQTQQPASQQQGGGETGTQKRKGGRPPAYPCLCCGENCTKSQQSVRCLMCQLWAHKDCLKMSDATFKNLEEQIKESGSSFWLCRPCQNFGQRIQHQFAENNKRHDATEKRVDMNARRIEEAEKDIEGLRDELRKMSEKLCEKNNESEDKICDEMQEREVRRMNLVLHGVDEQPDEIRSNHERMEKDKARCELIFSAMRARTRKEDLRFCRRIGERGDEPRPIVIGLENEEEKRHILNRARDLKGTRYNDISIVPDLTRKQRSREARMREEADEKNKDLTAEEKRRNVKWMVVGRRGEKRSIKGVEREQQQYRAGANARTSDRYYSSRNTEQRTDQTRDQQRPVVPQPAILPDRRTTTSNRWEPLARDEPGQSERSRNNGERRDERELGARSKNTNNRWQENRNAGATDRQESNTRWTEVVSRQNRRQSKRTRGSGRSSEEDENLRARQRN